MSSLGFNEILLIFLILLFAIGPKRIPGMARSVGRYLRYLRKAAQEFKEAINIDELRKELDAREIEKDLDGSIGKDLKSVEKDLRRSITDLPKAASIDDSTHDKPDKPDKPSGPTSGSLAG